MKKNLIPKFILTKFKSGRLRGAIKGSVLFLDIAGFTLMTESLMKQGKEGVEILSDLINNIFQPVIEEVYNAGGFISNFAGDAFTAIFTGSEHQKKSVMSSIKIAAIFKKIGTQNTKYGKYKLSFKIGISSGEITWGIVGTKSHSTFYFKGIPIDNSAQAEHLCKKNEIVIDSEILSNLPALQLKIKKLKTGYHQLLEFSVKIKSKKKKVNPQSNLKLLKHFIPDKILKHKQLGELRNIVSIFISFVEPKGFHELNQFIKSIISKTDSFGGYFNHLGFGDKNANILVIFGAPITYDDNIKRALRFIESLRSEFKNKIRVGATEGLVYAGVIGSERRSAFTCLGDIINLSARLMEKAQLGNVWVSEKLAKKIIKDYNLKMLGMKIFKGKSKPIMVFNILDRKKKKAYKLTENKLIGRKHELAVLKEYCKVIRTRKFGGIVYVYGEAGIGKSRLISDVSIELAKGSSIEICYMQADEILKKSLAPFEYYFNRFFNQQEKTKINQRKESFEHEYLKFLKRINSIKNKQLKEAIIANLRRIKPVLGAVLGLRWKDSLFETIQPKDRPEVTRFAIKDFFKAQSLLHPIIIILEDLHALDPDSQKVFSVLTRMIDDYPIIFLVSSRLNDDGSKPRLRLDKDVKINELSLEHLARKSINEFVENQLGYKCRKELIDYIKLKTEGNPFYIEQFCLYLQENNLLQYKLKKFSISKRDIPAIPLSINSILIARIDRLSQDLKNTVQLASVLGKEFEVKILLELIRILTLKTSKKDEGIALIPSFENILEKGTEENIWNALSDIKYIFKHALLRDAVYEMQLRARLREIHELTGNSIEQLYKEDKSKCSEVAFHYHKAEALEKAKDFYMIAGDYALEIFELDKALEFFNSALKIQLKIDKTDNAETGSIYERLGTVNLSKGSYPKAVKNFQISVEKMKGFKKTDERDFIKLQLFLIKAYQRNGEFGIPEKILKKLLKNLIRKFNIKSVEVGKIYYELASLTTRTGKYDKAKEYCNSALKIFSKSSRKQKTYITGLYSLIGTILVKESDYKNAITYLNKALKMNLKLFGEYSLSAANSYKELGVANYFLGNFQKALELFQKSLKILINTFGEKHPDIPDLYSKLAIMIFSLGDMQKSHKYHQLAHKINIELLGKKHFLTRWSYHGLANSYFYKGEFKKALELYQTELSITLEHHKGIHPDLSKIYTNMGLVFANINEHKKALEYYNKALRITYKIHGKIHNDVFHALANMANVYLELKDFKSSLKALKKALKIQLTLTGEKHQNVAIIYNQIGRVYFNLKKYDIAIRDFQKCIDIQINIYGEIHPFLAYPYNSIGDTYLSLKRYDEAIEYFNKSLKTQLPTVGDSHYDTAWTYSYLGSAYLKKKEYSKALGYYKKTLKIRANLWKNGNPLLAESLFYVAEILQKSNKLKESKKLFQEALAMAEKFKIKKLITNSRRRLKKCK